jgi:hypothetical protein
MVDCDKKDDVNILTESVGDNFFFAEQKIKYNKNSDVESFSMKSLKNKAR